MPEMPELKLVNEYDVGGSECNKNGRKKTLTLHEFDGVQFP